MDGDAEGVASSVTGHLIGGFTVLTLMTLLAVRFMRFEPEAKVDSQQASQLRSLIPLGWIAMAALCVQIFLGVGPAPTMRRWLVQICQPARANGFRHGLQSGL